MKSFIFITNEGYTYQPNSDRSEPDIENCQVIEFSEGNDENDAFKKLINENEYLLKTSFDVLLCIELKNKFQYNKSKIFSLNDLKDQKSRIIKP